MVLVTFMWNLQDILKGLHCNGYDLNSFRFLFPCGWCWLPWKRSRSCGVACYLLTVSPSSVFLMAYRTSKSVCWTLFDGWMSGQMDRGIDGPINESADRWMDEQVDDWVSGWVNGEMDRHFYTWLSVCISMSTADFSPSCVYVHARVHGCVHVHVCACSHTCLHMELAAFVISMHASHFGSIYLR